MKHSIFVLLSLILTLQALVAQNTVGLISKTNQAYEGYNLFFSHNQPNAYLLDNCGQIVHTWEDEPFFRPGNSAYLLENGNLIKCKRAASSTVNDRIWAGGGGEIVEIRTWENELLHSFTLNDSLYRLHHDVAPMPNGNILMIAWELKDSLESVRAGRDTALMAQNEVWSEVILEWNPVLDSIVWKWHVWDHLIQNYDATKEHFGEPNEHPELINLNYDEHNGHPDWLHINSIDYNVALDQIVLSIPYFNEFWVIDHAITTEAAATEKGDLLYRFGNPKAYDSQGDQQLFFQHDVHWINPYDKQSQIALFNNRVAEARSTVNILAPKLSADDSYLLDEALSFEATIVHPRGNLISYSNSLSSAQILPNGNALVLAGRWGYAYEVTPDNELAWEYRIPFKAGKSVAQGDTLTINNNITFRFERYGIDYPAFEGRDLAPKGYLEINPDEVFCDLVSTTEVIEPTGWLVYPNPANEVVWIKKEDTQVIKVFDSMGQLMVNIEDETTDQQIDLYKWPKGIYFLVASDGSAKRLVVD